MANENTSIPSPWMAIVLIPLLSSGGALVGSRLIDRQPSERFATLEVQQRELRADVADLNVRLSRFMEPGGRCTASQCGKYERAIRSMERSTAQIEQRLVDIERRITRNERHQIGSH